MISVLDNVFDVRGLGVPAEVGEPVICWIAVVVAGLHSVRPWANECFEDYGVKECSRAFSVSVKLHGGVTPVRLGAFDEKLGGASDRAKPTLI